MSVEKNKEVVLRGIQEVFNGGDYDVAAELMGEDIVDHRPAPGQPPGIEGVRWKFEAFRSAFPDGRMKVKDIVGEGDRVAVHVTNGGTHQGPFMDIPATGKKARWEGMTFFRLADGKIVEHWAVVDVMGMMQQLGLLPERPPGD